MDIEPQATAAVKPPSTEPRQTPKTTRVVSAPTCTNIDWYSEGQTRVVRIDGIEVRIRFVGRHGRRGRILVEAPAGAVFDAIESYGSINQPHR